MNRLKVLVAAALLGLPLAACEEGTTPPPVGEIEGQVVIEGEGMDGIAVTLSSGAATTTSNGGYYQFSDVEGGIYTVTISGYPEDASFDATSAEVTIASSGQTVTRNFSGSYIRTASLMGMVTVEGQGLPGITVTISGRQNAEQVTDANGQYTFTLLRAGNYTVEIADFDPTDVAFSQASAAVAIAVGESKVWSFDGTYVRESTIMGQVSVEGNGLGDVTVSLQGMGADEEVMTDDGGQYTFDNLRAGQYSVAISGYDAREFGFETTSATVMVEHGKTANQPFEGIMLRTASIMGQVSVEGEGLADVTVSLQGEGENQTTETNDSGHYTFTDLPAGNFQVGISGYDTDDYSFETTSRNVSLALGATATVPFEGILLRTSGISGRVSVEGMDLDSVTVTLSGDDLEEDRTEMTDATGQYAFAGLAEGAYTVAISDFDDVSYNFETTSMDVELGDDDVQIVNFMGSHARTASVSGMLYVDEAGKNDAYNEGEDALAVAGIALALVGPGIGDVMPGITGPDGSFAFPGLRAGPYQLVVVPVNPLIPQDYAYGGPTEGYSFALGVGDEKTQNIPFDITHTTVNFSVNLKSGDDMGDALPGATVSFFSDMAGEQKIGDAMSGDDGMASLRIARSAASNHTVYASVAAPTGSYDTDGAKQAVMWDGKSTMHAAGNSSDITNTMADFSFSGATITTDFGGGTELGGWAISVTSGDDAVEGAPTELGADGSASFSETAAAGKSYKVSIKADQANTLDGGETYEATSVEYTHTGLKLPATMDAGTMEVTYKTQTLKVYVHNERDQVMGFTGNILGGDVRTSAELDIAIRHIERTTGRSRAFPSTDKVKATNANGVYTFSNVPATAQVIVQADVKAGRNVKLLGEDELDAYTDNEDNGRMKGAFGDNGGYNHTVELCPLMSRSEDQRHGECGTFAVVNTYQVDGQVWENTVATNGAAGGFGDVAKTAVKGVVVSMDPVDGENLAGDSDSYTSGTDDKATRNFNEAMFFDWERKAAGEYKLNVSGGWVAKVGGPDDAVAFGTELNPLGADLQIDVSPTTGYVYGTVKDGDGFRVEGATVTANGESATTDAYGRYRIRGFSGATVDKVKNQVAMTVTKEGFAQGSQTIGFVANTPGDAVDFVLTGQTETATISGTVRSGGDPVSGVTISVNGGRPLGATKDLKTGADGSYTATVPTGAVTITPTKTGMTFVPASATHTMFKDQSLSGVDFTGFQHGSITGRVLTVGGGPNMGVTVTATPAGGGDAAASDVTDVRGVYSLSVPHGSYDVTARLPGWSFGDGQSVSVVPGGARSLEDFQAAGSSEPIEVAAERDVGTAADSVQYSGSATVTWAKGHGDDPLQYQVQVWGDVGGTGTESWEDNGSAITDLTALTHTISSADTAAIRIRVVAQIDDDGTAGFVRGDDTEMPSDEIRVAAIDETASNVEAERHVNTASADSITVTFEAMGASGAEWRVAVQFGDEEEWYTFATINTSARLAMVSASSTTDLNNVDTTATTNATKTPDGDLWAGAMKFRVDARRSSSHDWEVGTATATVAAKGG